MDVGRQLVVHGQRQHIAPPGDITMRRGHGRIVARVLRAGDEAQEGLHHHLGTMHAGIVPFRGSGRAVTYDMHRHCIQLIACEPATSLRSTAPLGRTSHALQAYGACSTLCIHKLHMQLPLHMAMLTSQQLPRVQFSAVYLFHARQMQRTRQAGFLGSACGA